MSPALTQLRRWGSGATDADTEVDGPAVDPRIQARRDQVVSERARRRRHRATGAAAVLGAVALVWLVTHSSLLAVHRMVITGTPHVPNAQVAQVAGIHLGQHLIDVDEAAARARLVRQPWVEHANVRVGWNGVAHLSVTERTPVLAVADGPSRWVLADAHSRSLAVVGAVPAGVVPVAGVAPVAPGRTFGPALAAPLAVAAHLTPGLRTRVGTGGITVGGDGSISIALQPSGVARLCQPVDLATKLSGLTTFFAHVDDRGLGVVDACVPDAITATRPAG
jgi:hypothetical protein